MEQKQYWNNNGQEVSKINDRHQTTDSGSLEDTQPSKHLSPRKPPGHTMFQLQKTKGKKKILKESRWGKPPYLWKNKDKS